MKITMLSDFYFPFLGGVETHVRTLSHALVARGHSVAVVTLWEEGLSEWDDDKGVRVYRVRGTMQRFEKLFANGARKWAPPFPDPQVSRALQTILAREQPQIVHGHDWLARAFLPLKPFTRARFIQTLHYYSLACAHKSLMFRDTSSCAGPELIKCLACSAAHYGAAKGAGVALANFAARAWEQRAVDLYLAVSQATAIGNGLETNTARCQVIPNFLPDDDEDETEVSELIAQLPQEPFFLFVGDLRCFKGIEVLLRAYAQLVNAPPLVLIGKAWAESPRAFPPHVQVFKNWSHAAVMAAWRRCYAAVVPSVWQEPFGMVVIEAMASGKAVIAARVGGIPEIIRDGDTGLLVAPGDADALRAAMQRLVDFPALCAQLGARAQGDSVRYRASAVVPRIERAYESVLAQQRASELFADQVMPRGSIPRRSRVISRARESSLFQDEISREGGCTETSNVKKESADSKRESPRIKTRISAKLQETK